MKKKRNLYIIAFLCFITLVGVTIAYLQSTDVFENVFNAGTYSVVTHEVFTSPTNWKPGDITPKTITTTNSGTVPVRVRVKLEESWTSHNNQPLELENNGIQLAIINFVNTGSWIKNGDYYYYVEELNQGKSTPTLIESITFNPEYQGDITCSIINNAKTCEASPNGYMQAKYKLNIITETVQADAYQEAWNLSYNPTENRITYYDSAGNYSSYEEVTKRVFLRKTFFGNTITKQELGFTYNNNAYYLKGLLLFQSDDYFQYQSENKAFLSENFYNKCSTHLTVMGCNLDDIQITVDLHNNIEATDNAFNNQCIIDYDGKTKCELTY